MKRVLAVGAHPDDVALGCGALIQRADKRHVVVLSSGEEGGNPLLRGAEELEACIVLGAALALHHQHDTAFGLNEVIRLLEREIEAFRPDLVLTHSAHDTHQDHRVVHDATLIATRDTDCTVLAYLGPSCASTFAPTFFAPVSDAQMSVKLKALHCYTSQAERAYMDPTYVGAIGKYWALSTRSSAQWVEPYEALRVWA